MIYALAGNAGNELARLETKVAHIGVEEAGRTAVCWNSTLEVCQEEVFLRLPITASQLLPR